jgi:hypothetical protein
MQEILNEILKIALADGISSDDKILDIISMIKGHNTERKEDVTSITIPPPDKDTKKNEKFGLFPDIYAGNLTGGLARENNDICLIDQARQEEIDRGVPEHLRTKAWFISCNCKKCKRISF